MVHVKRFAGNMSLVAFRSAKGRPFAERKATMKSRGIDATLRNGKLLLNYAIAVGLGSALGPVRAASETFTKQWWWPRKDMPPTAGRDVLRRLGQTRSTRRSPRAFALAVHASRGGNLAAAAYRCLPGESA